MEKEKVSSGNIIDWKVVKRILEFIRPYRGRFYFLIVLTFLLGVLTPIRPMLIQYTLDKHVSAGEYWSMVYVMVFTAITIRRAICSYLFVGAHRAICYPRPSRAALSAHCKPSA